MVSSRRLLLAIVAGLTALDVPARSQTAPAGVLVEAVGKGSAGERAGLKPGDVLERWERGVVPPANPREARGLVRTPFDLVAVEVEQAPRGEVMLSGVRSGQPFSVRVPAGRWMLMTRPQLPDATGRLYDHGKQLIEAKDLAAGTSVWRDLADQTAKSGDGELAAWLFARLAESLSEDRKFDEAQTAYQSAIAAAADRQNPEVLATIWDARGRAFERQSALKEASAAYQQAVSLRERQGCETLACAASLGRLGWTAFQRGDHTVAEEAFRRSHALFDAQAPASLELAASLSNLGALALSRGKFDTATDLYKQALRITESRAPGSSEMARALGRLGNLGLRSGDLLSAEDYHTRALAIVRTLSPGSFDEAVSLNALGLVAQERGDLTASQQRYEQALGITEAQNPGSLAVSSLLSNIGNVAQQRGDLAAAERAHERSIAIVGKIAPASIEEAECLNNLGLVLERRGELARAEELYRRAHRIYETRIPESPQMGASLTNLANVMKKRGDLESARDYQERALAIAEKGGRKGTDLAAILTGLGNIARQLGEYSKAMELHARALTIFEREAPLSVAHSVVLNNAGNVAKVTGDLRQAEMLHRRALDIRQKLAPGSVEVADSLYNLGGVALARGDRREAERYYTDAWSIVEQRAPDSLEAAETLRELGALAQSAGRTDETIAHYLRALDALEAHTGRMGGADDVRATFGAKYSYYYGDTVELQLQRKDTAGAFRVLERARARSLLAMLAERDLVLSADVPADLARARRDLDAEHDRIQAALRAVSADKPDEVERLIARFRDVRDRRAELVQQIRKSSPRFAALQYPEPLDLPSVQASLDRGTLLLAYSVGERTTTLFAVRRPDENASPSSGVSVFTVEMGEASLRESIRKLRTLIGGQVSTQGSARGVRGLALNTVHAPLAQEAQRLYRLLVQPAEPLVAACSRILIVGDGPLHSLPFATLMTPASKTARSRYLIEWKPLHVVVSATVYDELKKRRRGANEWSSGTALVAFGDPHYSQASKSAAPVPSVGAREGRNLQPLPATRREVTSIVRLFGDRATAYLGPDATEQRAKSVGTNIRYVHFASHGLVDRRFPLNSALVLSLPDLPDQSSENGLLQTWEVLEHIRLDADLVTLSACETALGPELAGEGLVGLTRAFHYAGARSVVASLWSVADDSTAVLMSRFYGHLTTGMSKAEALRAAQIDLVRAARPGSGLNRAFAHPFYWAAFQLFGDWQ